MCFCRCGRGADGVGGGLGLMLIFVALSHDPPAPPPKTFFFFGGGVCGGRSFLNVDRRLHAAFIGAIHIGGGLEGGEVSFLVSCSISGIWWSFFFILAHRFTYIVFSRKI